MAAHAYIYDAVRTPRGKGKASGALHGTKPVDLVVRLIQALRERNPGLDEGRIADLVLGIVSPVGDQGMVLPRTAALLAGMPDTVPGLQVNRFCGSGLSAVNTAAEKVAAGWEDVVLAGGVESMSRVPMGSDGGAWAMDPATSMRLGFTPQGVSIDLLATIEGITREDVDAYAARSHQRAAHAWEQGWFDRSIVPVRDVNGQLLLDRDEIVRPDATVESLGALKPSFAQVGAQGGFDAVALQRYPQAERVDHIRQQMREDDRAYAMNLALIRRAADLTQVELARRLGVGQAAVSKVERQHDLLLSTLSSYVAAAGANARIVVTVGDRDLEFDLATLADAAPPEQ